MGTPLIKTGQPSVDITRSYVQRGPSWPSSISRVQHNNNNNNKRPLNLKSRVQHTCWKVSMLRSTIPPCATSCTALAIFMGLPEYMVRPDTLLCTMLARESTPLCMPCTQGGRLGDEPQDQRLKTGFMEACV